MRSSTQMIPNFPSCFSMMSLEVITVLLPSSLTNPRLYISSRTDFRLGVPQVMKGSQILSMLMVALLSLTKTPLLICLSLKSWRAFLTLGATWLTPRILMTKANILAFNLAVLLGVLLGPLEDVCALVLASGGVSKGSLLALGTGGSLALATLQNGLGDRWELLVWHSEKSSRLPM